MVIAGIYAQHWLQLGFYLGLNISIAACSNVGYS